MIRVNEFGPLNLMPRPWRQSAPAAAKGTQGGKDGPHRHRRRATYTRTKGGRHLFAALDLTTDKMYGHVKATKNRTDFLGFRRYLRALYPYRTAIVLGRTFPRAPTPASATGTRPNVEFAHVTTNASWLNCIERHPAA